MAGFFKSIYDWLLRLFWSVKPFMNILDDVHAVLLERGSSALWKAEAIPRFRHSLVLTE